MANVPYEFLVRFDETGAVKGSHIKFFDTVTRQELSPMPVSDAGANGFPVAEITNIVNVGALTTIEMLKTKLLGKQTELDALTNEPTI